MIYICMIQVFVNIDRSKSFYVLYWIKNNKIVFDDSNSTYILGIPKINDRISDFDFSQRVEEHKLRGLVRENNGELRLTFIGSKVLLFSEFTAEKFNLRGWVGKKF